MSRVQGVIFDAFGTVLQIKNARHLFRQLLKLGIAQGRRPRSGDAAVLMTKPFSLEQAANHFEIVVRPSELAHIQAELDGEVAAIETFPDAVTCIQILRTYGVKVAICSNLAFPYGAAVDRIFPDLDASGTALPWEHSSLIRTSTNQLCLN